MGRERATYFCIDIECTGQVPGLFDMISLGGVPVRAAADGSLGLGTPFYVEIQPAGGGVDPGAMAVHGLTLEHLQAHGVPRGEALARLDDWVKREAARGTRAVFVGHNAPFDWSFVAYAYAAEGRRNPFGYKALDTKALSAGVLGIHWFDTSKETLARLLDLPEEDAGQKHRADYDAWYQALVLRALLERQRSRRA